MRVSQEVTVQPFHHEPPALTADMTKADLIEVLEHLPLQKDRCVVEIDREVRDYLLTLLRRTSPSRGV